MLEGTQFFLLYSIFVQNKRDFFHALRFSCKIFSAKAAEMTTNVPNIPPYLPKNPIPEPENGSSRKKAALRRLPPPAT